MKANTVNIKQPKYILPMIAFPFLILFGYLAIDMFGNKKEEINTLEITEGINSNLPEPIINPKKDLDKFGAYQDEYKKEKDYSGVKKLSPEDEDKSNTNQTIYSDEEIAEIEMTHQKTADEAKKVRELQNKYFGKENNTENTNSSSRGEPKGKQIDEIETARQQIAYIDSIRKAAEQKSKENPIQKNQVQQIQKEPEDVLEARKTENPNAMHFNTIKSEKNDDFITAILDEVQNVTDGSRIRIRLLDDIFVGNELIKKGSYLYGLVSGFAAQRVLVNINSIPVNNKILKTNLTIYDSDGIKGLYVPASDFRELLQQAGAQLGQQQVSIEQDGNSFEQFAYGALQDIYRSTTQAISKKIKQNKARLKYATEIYLINEKEQKTKN